LILIADIDIQLLLAVQYACNKTGTKIPWKETAEVLGPKFTEGAIVQHLSKLRTKRDELKKPCPPPLKRAAGSSSKNGMEHKKTLLPSPMEDLPLRSTRQSAAENRRVEDSEDDVYAPKRKEEQKKREPARHSDTSSSDGSESIYTIKAKTHTRAHQKHYPTDLFLAASMKPDSSEPVQKLIHTNAEWLKDFAARSKSDDDESYSESTSSSQSTGQSTAQSVKKTKIVTLKIESEHLASVESEESGIGEPRYVELAAFPAPVTPPQVPRVVVNQPPQRRGTNLPYMASNNHQFGFMAPQNFHGMQNTVYSGIYPVQYPSSAPSPFDIMEPVVPNRAQTTQSVGHTDYNFMDSYPIVEVPPELIRNDIMRQNDFPQEMGYSQNYGQDYTQHYHQTYDQFYEEELFPNVNIDATESPCVKHEGNFIGPNDTQDTQDIMGTKEL
jgi:hypothetical protein